MNKKIKLTPQKKFKKRILSGIVDFGVFLVIWTAYSMLVGEPNDRGGYTLNGLPALMVVIFWFLYFPIPEAASGKTLGKAVLGLKVVKTNGQAIGFRHAFVRHLFDIADVWMTFGILGTLLIAYKGKRLGDLVTDTVLIGGEEARCDKCAEEFELEPQEVVSGTFTCPACQHHNVIEGQHWLNEI